MYVVHGEARNRARLAGGGTVSISPLFVPKISDSFALIFPKCSGLQGGVSRPTTLGPKEEVALSRGHTHTLAKPWTVDCGQWTGTNLENVIARFGLDCPLSTVHDLVCVCVCPLDSGLLF